MLQIYNMVLPRGKEVKTGQWNRTRNGAGGLAWWGFTANGASDRRKEMGIKETVLYVPSHCTWKSAPDKAKNQPKKEKMI